MGASLGRAPRVLPLSFPKFAHKREAVACGVRSHAAWVLQGPSQDTWAVWGPVGCVGAVPTLHHTRALPQPKRLDAMANGGWLGLVHSTSCPVWEKPRESIVLPRWLFFCVKKWKEVVGVHSFDLSEISVLCQGSVRPVMMLCPLAEDCSFARNTGSPVASRTQELEGTVLDNPLRHLSKPSALAYCGAKKPKRKG